jgi:ATP-dependent DNA ligase
MTRDVHNIPPALPSISNARSRISSIVGGDSRFTAAAAHILLPVTDVNDEPNARRAPTAHTLPSGDQWLHEIKHDGFRIIAPRDGPRVRLYSRPGNDLNAPASR